MAREPDFSIAEDPQRIAEAELIPQYHPHLMDAKMLFVFTTQKRKKCDRVRLGSAAKLPAFQRWLHSGMKAVDAGADFVIMIDVEEYNALSRSQQRALIEHELCHCGFVDKVDDETGEAKRTWKLHGHDVEAFVDEVKRHGLWRQGISDMVEVGSRVYLKLDTTP